VTKIIAFSGRKQSGKSTAGEYVQGLIRSINPKINIKTYSFADPLKRNICIDLLGLTEQQCYGSDEDKNSLTNVRWENMPNYDISWTYDSGYDPSGFMTARQVMEFVGTRIFRKMKDNIWVEATLNEIKKDNADIAFLLDNRFPNEVDAVLNTGGFVIRLARDPFRSWAEPEVALDPIKYDWTKFSCIIDNQDCTIDEKNYLIKRFLINQGILPL
jgi:hypothetical protein